MELTDIILKWKRENKLKKDTFINLLDAYRRIDLFNKSIDDDMLILGVPSRTDKIYFKSYGTETPNVTNWYGLTSEGKTMIRLLQNAINNHVNEIIDLVIF